MRGYRRIILGVLVSLTLNSVSSQFTLTIKVTDLRSNDGLISLELFDEKKNIIKKVEEPIQDSICVIVFDNLKQGKYAIRFFHDENSNGEMDTNWLGMPQEGYGFSNNAFGFFGPKDFKEWLFDLNGNKEIVFKTKY